MKLIAIISQAIAFLAATTANTKALIAAVADKDAKLASQASTIESQATVIETLQAAHAQDDLDDAALEKAAADARAEASAAKSEAEAEREKTIALQQQIDEATSKAEELAAAITAAPEVPNVDAEFRVSDPGATEAIAEPASA